MYRLRTGKEIDIKNPQTYNEKLQWLKIYNRHDFQHSRVDKLTVKDIVAREIDSRYIIPTIGIWDSPAQIDFDTLPERFVLKTTHGYGGKGVVVCNNPKTFNREKALKILGHAMRKNNYPKLREWPYKGLKPRIIAEKYIGTDKEPIPTDYKFFCFDGHAEYVMVCKGRNIGGQKPRYYFFDRAWNFCPFNKADQNTPAGFTLPKPDRIDEMFDIADKLSRNEPHVRIDLYYIDNRIYFGEITYFNASGYDKDISEETDRHFGTLIKLPKPSYKP
ncbi:ATP-grasp fold amidoligase family protein [uncultured Muribaculum sp.]|uniref:ATP-grasp fold amidoligase family protein n=1 Tax=uncultured Muribaculum sp. TaxID=1918613 RepID=UPI0025B26CF7|nr:ATP-grasp fold amidoligase family protein [uncultured Muribaculum sp.]